METLRLPFVRTSPHSVKLLFHDGSPVSERETNIVMDDHGPWCEASSRSQAALHHFEPDVVLPGARQDGMRTQLAHAEHRFQGDCRQVEVRQYTTLSCNSAVAKTRDCCEDDRNRHVVALRRSWDTSH